MAKWINARNADSVVCTASGIYVFFSCDSGPTDAQINAYNGHREQAPWALSLLPCIRQLEGG